MTASTSGSRTGGGDKNEIKKKIVIEARSETVPPWILWGSRMSKTSMVKFKMRLITIATLAARGVARFQLKPMPTTGTSAAPKVPHPNAPRSATSRAFA